MTNWHEVRLTIVFPIIIGVILAVLYDMFQEVFKLFLTPPAPFTMSPLLLSAASKLVACAITIVIGVAILFLKYRNSSQSLNPET